MAVAPACAAKATRPKTEPMEREAYEGSEAMVDETLGSQDPSGGQPAASLTSDLIERGKASKPVIASGVGDAPGQADLEFGRSSEKAVGHLGTARNQPTGTSKSAEFPASSAKAGLVFHFGGIRMRDIALIATAYVVFLGLLIALIPD